MDPSALKPTTPVRLLNNTDETFSYDYERDTYVIEPHSEVFWPWDVAKCFLGDPFAKDTPAYEYFTHGRLVAQRNLGALRRIDKRGVLHEVIPFEKWDPVKPDIQVFDMSGERILMSHELSTGPTNFNEGFTEQDMKMKVAELERQLSNMKLSMEHDDVSFVATETAAGEEQVTTLDELPADEGPRTAPNKRFNPNEPIG